MKKYHLVETQVQHGDYTYCDKFIVYAPDGLPANADQILTSWEFDLPVKYIEENWETGVWHDVRVVRARVKGRLDEKKAKMHDPWSRPTNFNFICTQVEYGDERDQEVA